MLTFSIFPFILSGGIQVESLMCRGYGYQRNMHPLACNMKWMGDEGNIGLLRGMDYIGQVAPTIAITAQLHLL
jgi:hypothetical protein